MAVAFNIRLWIAEHRTQLLAAWAIFAIVLQVVIILL